MKTAIIFHSVCGNTYLMAKAFFDSLEKQGKKVKLYRVADDDLEDLANLFPVASKYLQDIKNVGIATPEVMLENDHIILGSPTYFGNVSSEMKAYMDSVSAFWVEGKLVGKKLTAFTSASNSEGGGALCLQAINTFAQHMGMISIPVPSNLMSDKNFHAYGIISYSGSLGDRRPDGYVYEGIEKYSKMYIN